MTTTSQDQHHLRIDYVELPVTDLAAAKRFYGTVFGWRFQDFGPDYTAFEDGRLSGSFARASEVRRGGPLVIVYSRELEATLQQVRAAGGAVSQEIFSFPGGRRFHFTDPAGNELAVWSDR